MNYPLVSVVIATYNSEKSLEKVLEAVKYQNYPRTKMEIIILDGGSTDKTLEIGRKFNCKIYNNPKVDQVYGKFTGYKKAKGKYMLLLDSDEVMKDKNSIKNKALSMIMNEDVKVSVSSGLSKPESYPDINYYLNEFGDPFSYFMYHNSKDPNFFVNDLKKSYKKVFEDKDRIFFDFSSSSNPPFIELTAMGVMVDREYIKKSFPSVFKIVSLHTHLFFLMNKNKKLFSVMKHDPIVHYSVSSLKGYLKKIRSRVTSNIFSTNMGIAGFSGREEYHSEWYKLKKYFFIIYALLVVFPLIDSIYLVLSRKRIIYLIHFPLTIYTALIIVFFYLRKTIGIKTKTYTYGG